MDDPLPSLSTPVRTDFGWLANFGEEADRERLLTLLNRGTVIEAISRRAVHDLRNSLQAVTMAAEALEDDPDDPDAESLMTLIGEGARKAESALGWVGSAPFRFAPEPEPVVVSEVIEWVVAAARPSRQHEGIRTVVDLAPLPPVLAAEGPLRHALLNLVLNARDALEERGEGTIEITGRETRDAVCVTVSDEGPGVPAELRQGIFEPFFTTKVGEGHFGLGLPVAASIVRPWGGVVEFAPAEREAGAAGFLLRLPAAR